MFLPPPVWAQGSCGRLPAPQDNAGVAPLQPAHQKRLQRCWSCSLGNGGWERLLPLPQFRSSLHTIFHQFSPLEIRCVWLVAEHINDCSESWFMCSYHKHLATVSHWWWRCGFMWREWTSLNKINSQHALETHTFFRWKIKSSEVENCQIFAYLANPNSAR